MDKKDEEEIEKWKKQKMNYVETFGIDIFAQKKKTQVGRKVFNLLDKTIKGALVVWAIFIVVVTSLALVLKWQEIYSKVHVDPVKTISQMYGKKVKVVYKQLDKNRNGRYILTLKQNESLQFVAITQWTTMKNDYSDRCQKYYFEKWESNNKPKIKTEETYENRILKYVQYIKINDYEEIEDAVKVIHEFVKFAGEYYFPDWELYLKTEKGNIQPFYNTNTNLEDAIANAKSRYIEIQTKPQETKTNDPLKEFIGIPML